MNRFSSFQLDELPSHKLSPKYAFSSPFSLIRSPLEFSTFFPCQHDEFISHSSEYGNCKQCGAYMNRNSNIFGLKTKKQAFKLDFPCQQMFETMLKVSDASKPKKPLIICNNYLKNRGSLIDWMFDIAKKLELSLNTAHLAVTYLDIIKAQDQEDTYPIHLYSTTSLLLAAKAIELDERIPFLPRLKKVAAPMYQVQDFKRAEHEILSILDWKLQLISLFDVLEYYVAQGILFISDEINGEEIQFQKTGSPSPTCNNNNDYSIYKEQKFTSPFLNKQLSERNNSARGLNSSTSTGMQWYGQLVNEKKIYETVGLIEKDIAKLALLIAKDAGFYELDTKVLAAACIAFLRKVNGITPFWNQELENISMGVKEDNIKEVLKNFLNKFTTHFDSFSFHKKEESFLTKEFGNLRLNKENTSLQILKKGLSAEDNNKSFDNLSGFSGYLKSYTLPVDPEISNVKMNTINKAFESRKANHVFNNTNPLNNANNSRIGSGYFGLQPYSRNYEDIANNNNINNYQTNTHFILKDAENKLNIYNNSSSNNGFRNYFQEKNTSIASDINITSLTKKIDDIYGKIFTNNAITKKN